MQPSQQLPLDAAADVADLVEKERAAGGLLEQATPRAGRSGEAAAGVAEELALEDALGDGAAVDGDERA